MMKMAWDMSIYSMAIDELKPRTIIELGTGSGATAMWLADEVKSVARICQWRYIHLILRVRRRLQYRMAADFTRGSRS